MSMDLLLYLLLFPDILYYTETKKFPFSNFNE